MAMTVELFYTGTGLQREFKTAGDTWQYDLTGGTVEINHGDCYLPSAARQGVVTQGLRVRANGGLTKLTMRRMTVNDELLAAILRLIKGGIGEGNYKLCTDYIDELLVMLTDDGQTRAVKLQQLSALMLELNNGTH